MFQSTLRKSGTRRKVYDENNNKRKLDKGEVQLHKKNFIQGKKKTKTRLYGIIKEVIFHKYKQSLNGPNNQLLLDLFNFSLFFLGFHGS